jgi:hypothetical protein
LLRRRKQAILAGTLFPFAVGGVALVVQPASLLILVALGLLGLSGFLGGVGLAAFFTVAAAATPEGFNEV